MNAYTTDPELQSKVSDLAKEMQGAGWPFGERDIYQAMFSKTPEQLKAAALSLKSVVTTTAEKQRRWAKRLSK